MYVILCWIIFFKAISNYTGMSYYGTAIDCVVISDDVECF